MAWPYTTKETGKKAKAESKKKAAKSASRSAAQSKDPSAPRKKDAIKKDPMEGVTLKMVVERLEAKYGWDELAARIRINCFAKDPSVKSSLKFLRRTPWARAKVEALYLESDWTQ